MSKKTSTTIVILIIIVLLAIVLVQKFGNKSLTLTYTSTSTQTAINTPTNTAMYMCDNDKTITAAYFAGQPSTAPQSPNQMPTPTGTVALTFNDGSTMNLNQTISADGGRYANADESFVFWDKGNGAMVLQNGMQKDYTGCIVVAPNPAGQNLTQAYANSTYNFSIRLANGYTPDASYTYQEIPNKPISGIKFTIPAATATGTNLASDSYISVEQLPKAQTCTATMFLDDPSAVAKSVTDNGTDYSMATSNGAGAGNRYDETVYAIPGSSPCTAVRYFIHYGAIENYPPGKVTEFNEQNLINQFDAIRRTLTLN